VLKSVLDPIADFLGERADALTPRGRLSTLTGRIATIQGLEKDLPTSEPLTEFFGGRTTREISADLIRGFAEEAAGVRRELTGEQLNARLAANRKITAKQKSAADDAAVRAAEAREKAETHLLELQKEGAKLDAARAAQYDKDRAAAFARSAAVIKELAGRERIIATLEREPGLLALSTGERRVQEELLRAQEASTLALTDLDKQRVRVAVEQTAAIEAATKAAEEQARETERRIQVSTDRIVDFGADAFDRIFESGVSSFKDLGAEMVGIMRKSLAQIVADPLIRPIVP
jgi:hypothetical protein